MILIVDDLRMLDTSVMFFFSSRRRHTRLQGDWSSDVCSSDLKLRGVLRAESFDDKNGSHFGTVPGFPGAFAASDTKYKEVTATVSFLASDSFEARGEVRRDQANNAVFSDSTGATSKSMTSIALQGIYQF